MLNMKIFENQFHLRTVNMYVATHFYDRLYSDNPAQNIVHVTFMFHAIIIDLHALHNMHVVMLMYIHVSCIVHEFRTFSMHVT